MKHTPAMERATGAAAPLPSGQKQAALSIPFSLTNSYNKATYQPLSLLSETPARKRPERLAKLPEPDTLAMLRQLCAPAILSDQEHNAAS